jgi:alkanesulfonate monooxygenase SsuD/methylene tetrahydromethanopterin reductase-like flavin-dependent oxidoreductase (luciferase family)
VNNAGWLGFWDFLKNLKELQLMSQCFLESPSTSTAEREVSALQNPERERLRVLVIGSRDGVVETIHDLHHRGFAEVGLWSPLLPAPSSGEVMSILTRDRRVEG